MLTPKFISINNFKTSIHNEKKTTVVVQIKPTKIKLTKTSR